MALACARTAGLSSTWKRDRSTPSPDHQHTSSNLGRNIPAYRWQIDPQSPSSDATATGAAGVLKDGGAGRLKAINAVAASLGGSVESAYWALGPEDFYIVAELPDSKAAAALSLTVAGTGAARLSTAELFSAADVDEIVSRRVTYSPPGS